MTVMQGWMDDQPILSDITWIIVLKTLWIILCSIIYSFCLHVNNKTWHNAHKEDGYWCKTADSRWLRNQQAMSCFYMMLQSSSCNWSPYAGLLQYKCLSFTFVYKCVGWCITFENTVFQDLVKLYQLYMLCRILLFSV